MDSLYYTPSIEEFYVGFEYEYNKRKFKGDINWVSDTFKLGFDDENDLINLYKEGYQYTNLRVKYLDKSDIEELGFVCTNTNDPNCTVFEKVVDNLQLHKLGLVAGKVLLKFHTDGFVTILYQIKQGMNLEQFNGIIKNKSELKQVLKMLNIK